MRSLVLVHEALGPSKEPVSSVREIFLIVYLCGDSSADKIILRWMLIRRALRCKSDSLQCVTVQDEEVATSSG